LKNKQYARHLQIFHQIENKNKSFTYCIWKEFLTIWQHVHVNKFKNVNKIINFITLNPESNSDLGYLRLVITYRQCAIKIFSEWSFILVLKSGDIETNPGPVKGNKNTLKVITYNIRGLKEYSKLKRVLNKCAVIIGHNKNTIINLQETHLEDNDRNKIEIMWRGNWIISPGSQKSRGCLTLFDHSWELLDKWADPGGRSCIITIKKAIGIFCITNLYAPNVHSITFFEEILLRQIETKDKFNANSIVVGDFNLCLDPSIDSTNRKQSDNERIVVDFIKDSLRAIKHKDAYRCKQATGGYTWNRARCFSRLDMVFSSEELVDQIKSTNIDWVFDKSDHAAVIVEFEINSDVIKGPGLPRVDLAILGDSNIKNEFKQRLIECLESIPVEWDPIAKWEFIKVAIRSIAWELKSKYKKIINGEEEALSKQINLLKNNKAKLLAANNLTAEGELVLDSDILHFENIINQNFEQKSKELALKAKVKWFNEGEKSNKYFLNIIKKRQQESTISLLTDGNIVAKEQGELEKLVVNFYGKLYEENTNLIHDLDFDSFYDPETPMIEEHDRECLDKEITLEELKKTISACKDSAPGPDGIPYGIYKHFWEVLGPYSLKCWNYSCSKGILPDSQRTSSITLLPKEGKDLSNIGNWRPITLTNCDLKIYTKLIANRVSKVLDKIIHPSQTAYIPGRNVHDNLRMFEFYRRYCEENNIDAVLMSMDAKKAFDSVDHKYMYKTLKKYGFSDEFIKTIKLLYKDIKADIMVNGFRTTLIRIRRCVKQGDALSCALFIICIDPLLRNIHRNSLIRGIKIRTPLTKLKFENKTGAFADDVGTLVENSPECINGVFREYRRFSDRSGIMLNETKTEILSLGRGTDDIFVPKTYTVSLPESTFRLESVESIKICGVTFSHNRDLAYKNNVSEKLNKLKEKLMSWQFRGLSLGGKITIVKTFGISQLIYTMQACGYAVSDLENVEAFIFKFLWSKNCNIVNAPDRIRRVIMKQDYDRGGLKVPDLKNLDYALKLKQFVRANFSNHPIKVIQQWQMENVEYDQPLQQEYSRIVNIDSVTAGAQMCINKLTDVIRSEIGEASCPNFKVDLIASTDVLEYLKRRKLVLLQTWYMVLFRCGIENLKQLIAESMYPRSDHFQRLSLNILTAFPKEWITRIKEYWECHSEIELNQTFCVNSDKPTKWCALTVGKVRSRILQKLPLTFKFESKLGIQNRPNKNPFLVAREVNHSVAQKIFKFRLLHLDVFCKERMFKFKMVQSQECDRCGQIETIKHVLWECVRAKKVWDFFKRSSNKLRIQCER